MTATCLFQAQKPSTFIIGNKTDKEPRRVKREEAEHVGFIIIAFLVQTVH